MINGALRGIESAMPRRNGRITCGAADVAFVPLRRFAPCGLAPTQLTLNPLAGTRNSPVCL
jgi:hypothetical protein